MFPLFRGKAKVLLIVMRVRMSSVVGKCIEVFFLDWWDFDLISGC